MKKIGLLGGMSWESTQDYYRYINQGIRSKLGKLHSAEVILYSVDFEEIKQHQYNDNWRQTAHILSNAATSLEKAGADCLLICTNTMHKVAPEVSKAISIPVIHIAEATATQAKADKITKLGLLGTAFTMEQSFYKGKLEEEYGFEVFIPNESERREIHRIIFEELCLGQIHPSSKAFFLNAMEALVEQGAQAIILGCTEIGMLVSQSDTDTLLYDTTVLHAQSAVEFALSDIKLR